MNSPTRPEHVYPLKGDRTRVPVIDSNKYVTAAFRVHYRIDCQEPGTHQVTPLMWENEAVTFAENVKKMPGMSLVETPSRPDGIERIKGSNESANHKTDPFAWWYKRAQEIGEQHMASEERAEVLQAIQDHVLPFLSRAPEHIRDQLYATCMAAGTDTRKHLSSMRNDGSVATVDNRGKVGGRDE